MTIQANFPSISPSLMLDFANMEQMDPRVTFARSTPAVYYDGNTTALAEQNLQLYSQNFANALWLVSNVSKTSTTTTAPDGTSTAITFTASAVSASNFQIVSPSFTGLNANTVYTGSLFVKKGNSQYCWVTFYNNAGSDTWASAVVDLDNGTITQTSNGSATIQVASSIVSYGSGWYRVSVQCSWATVSFVSVRCGYVNTATPTFGGNGFLSSNITPAGTETVIAWGAQVEQRTFSGAYTATTTQQISTYIPVLRTAGGGQPRFDHNPITSDSLGLLIEEQRTNLVQYSGDFGNAYWSKSSATVTSNTIVAPDGTLTGAQMAASSAAGYVFRVFPATAATYTQSFYAKAGSTNLIRLDFVTSGFGTGASCTFDLSTGTAGTIIYYGGASGFSAAIYPVGNGWYRCSITGLATAANWFLELALINDSGKFVYIWGGQIEAGTFASSYIATTSAAVTRAADVPVMDGNNFSSWFNAGEGTFFTEVRFPVPGYNASNTYHFEASDGSSFNRMIGYTGGSQAQMFVSAYNATFATLASVAAPAINTNYRCAFIYEVNNFALSVNAQTAVTDNSGLIPLVNKLNIGANYSSAEQLNGWLRKLAYYPQAVTTAQIQALTS